MAKKNSGRRLRTDFNCFVGGKIHRDAADAMDRMAGTKEKIGALPNCTRQLLLTCAILHLEAEVLRLKIFPNDDLETRLNLLT